MNDNVISISSRKSLEETKRVASEQAQERQKLSIDEHLSMLDSIRKLVSEGKIEGLIVIGRNAETGLFLTDVAFPGGPCPPESAISYVGVLELLKLEMADVASMAPVLMSDGTVLDPEIEADE